MLKTNLQPDLLRQAPAVEEPSDLKDLKVAEGPSDRWITTTWVKDTWHSPRPQKIGVYTGLTLKRCGVVTVCFLLLSLV